MCRLALIAVCLLAFPLAGRTQGRNPEQSWDNLRMLGAGEKIQVVEQNLKSLNGRFRNFSDDALTFQVDRGEVTVPRPEVYRVTSLERTRRGRNAAIGFAVGAGTLGALAIAVTAAGEKEIWPEAALAIPLYGAIGAGVGAIFPSHKTIYRAGRRQGQTAP